jgi:hypothetical protein
MSHLESFAHERRRFALITSIEACRDWLREHPEKCEDAMSLREVWLAAKRFDHGTPAGRNALRTTLIHYGLQHGLEPTAFLAALEHIEEGIGG